MRAALPGLALVGVIACAGFGLRGLPVLSTVSPMILAILLGMLLHNLVGTPERAARGVRLAGKGLLRLAVALLGLQLTVGDMAAVGAAGAATAALALLSTFAFTIWLGRRLGVAPPLACLIAAGTSICGASAIAGANAVIKAKDEDVAYAVACITLFGTIAMLGLPLVQPLLGLDADAYGIFVGASVHEVAQVVGAAYQGGEAAGEVGVVVKLTRVLMLAPMIVALGAVVASWRSGDSRALTAGTRPLAPGFVLAFAGLVLLNSLGLVPAAVRDPLVSATPILLTVAMAALGLGADVANMRSRGARPLVLAGIATLFIAAAALGLVHLTA